MEKKKEGGFVLVLALIGILILMATGYFALTVATSDLMVASRLVGERKAFQAAEAGVHALCSHYTGTTADNTGTSVPSTCTPTAPECRQVDSVSDPHSYYVVTGSTEIPGLSQSCTGAFSIEGGVSWHCKNYRSVVTGRNTLYNSTVSIAIGVKGKAIPDTPGYDFN
ncbi:MAG: pilus assembly PilX N-terminal domain-containing protein [Syntrophaceae bacterium]|nr:pilus assembly PilX N-terminal domain-containing protein [Syntrophaceae bacterium]